MVRARRVDAVLVEMTSRTWRRSGCRTGRPGCGRSRAWLLGSCCLKPGIDGVFPVRAAGGATILKRIIWGAARRGGRAARRAARAAVGSVTARAWFAQNAGAGAHAMLMGNS